MSEEGGEIEREKWSVQKGNVKSNIKAQKIKPKVSP